MHTNTQQARWCFPSQKKHIVLFFSFSSPVKNVTRVHVCVHVHGNKRHTNTHIKGRCCPVLRSDRNPHRRAKLASSDRKMFQRSVKIRADANQTDGSRAGRHWFPQSAARDVTEMCRSKQQQNINAENYSWIIISRCSLNSVL